MLGIPAPVILFEPAFQKICRSSIDAVLHVFWSGVRASARFVSYARDRPLRDNVRMPSRFGFSNTLRELCRFAGIARRGHGE